MHRISRFLGFVLILQCSLYGADTPVIFSQEELLKEVLYQKLLQKYLVHSAAYSLMCVSKEFSKLMDEWRLENRNMVWSFDQDNAFHLRTNNVLHFTLAQCNATHVNHVVNVDKESITFDASCNKAYGIHEDTALKIPSLYYFSWPSRDVIKRKGLLSVLPTYTHGVTQTFFWRGIGIAYWHDDNNVDIISYLPTGYMVHIKKEFNKPHAIKLWGGIDYQSRRSTIICKSYDYNNGYQTIFTTDTSAVLKDGAGTIIPWQKIEWDE